LIAHSWSLSQIKRGCASDSAATVSKYLPEVLKTIAARAQAPNSSYTAENAQLLELLPAFRDAAACSAVLSAIATHNELGAKELLSKASGLAGLKALVDEYGWPSLEDAMEMLVNIANGSLIVPALLYLLQHVDVTLPAHGEIKSWALSQELPQGETSDSRRQCIELALCLEDKDLLQLYVAGEVNTDGSALRQVLARPAGERSGRQRDTKRETEGQRDKDIERKKETASRLLLITRFPGFLCRCRSEIPPRRRFGGGKGQQCRVLVRCLCCRLDGPHRSELRAT
jgi:hypothetical protein